MNINILTKEDLGCLIRRVSNGWVVVQTDDEDEWYETVFQEDEDWPCPSRQRANPDEGKLKAGEQLLWEVVNALGLSGSRHDKERLVIRREPGDKYEDGKEGT